MTVSKSIFKSIFKGYSRGFAGGDGNGPDQTNLLAWYRTTIDEGKLIAYAPPSSHTTQQVKSSGFFSAGSATVTGLTTAHTFTATGDLPTCTVNGTLTLPGPDCCDVRAFLDGVLWAYWPGINVGQTTELDASDNGHHLTGLVGTTITERVDGSGSNYVNEVGYSVADGLTHYGDISESFIIPAGSRFVIGYKSDVLLSVWNAKTPTVCPIGPTIETSVAGDQPDADGNMVPWPVLHPGKGVMVQPAYSNLLPAGREDFTTGWILVNTEVSLVDGYRKIQVVADGGTVQLLYIAINSTTVTYSVVVKKGSGATDCNVVGIGNVTTSTILCRVAINYDTGVLTYLAGSDEASATYIATGEWLISMTVPFTSGDTAEIHAGFVGMSETAGEYGYFKNPMLVGSPYQMPYAPPGTSVTSTASTSGGNGLAIPLNAAMTAALSGGAFTAAALVEMGVSSAQVTAPANIFSVDDVVSGLIFADSGGKLKSTDGTTVAEVTVAGGWARTDELLAVKQINAAGTTQRIGYAKNTFTAITWGAAVAYDGSQNPLTHERIGINSVIPFGVRQTQLWNKSASDAEILRVVEYAV